MEGYAETPANASNLAQETDNFLQGKVTNDIENAQTAVENKSILPFITEEDSYNIERELATANLLVPQNMNESISDAVNVQANNDVGRAGLGGQDIHGTENIPNIDNYYNSTYTVLNGGNNNARSAEFRELQEASKRIPDEVQELYRRGGRRIDEALRRRLSGVLGEEVERCISGNGHGNELLTLKNGSNEYNIYKDVDGSLFHDVFEVTRKYLKNGELVDLHGAETTDNGIGYNDCRNYLSKDGLSGFSITPEQGIAQAEPKSYEELLAEAIDLAEQRNVVPSPVSVKNSADPSELEDINSMIKGIDEGSIAATGDDFGVSDVDNAQALREMQSIQEFLKLL